jgi:glycosyltransferase involved in cell wall biosynthesis
MLSLSMIVKNEEKYLRDCLESVKGIVDEIIIVDTGSTDKTKKIAEEYGASIYDYEWKSDFADARNYALDKSNGDWILYLDADERLSASSKDELKRITSAGDKKAYHCRIINIDEKNNKPSVMSYVRLFAKTGGINFEGRIHEQIENSLRKNGYKISESKIEIIHIGYNLEKEGLKQKAQRNLDILLEEYKKIKNGYNSFQIAQSLHILERDEEALEHYKKAVDDNSLRNEYKATAFRAMAIGYADSSDYANADKYISYSLKQDGHQPMSLMAAAKIYSKNLKNELAINCIKEAFKYNKQYRSGALVSAQNILLDPRIILYNGLSLSVGIEDKKNTEFFLDELKKEIKKEEYDLFSDIISKKNIDLGTIDIKSLINDYNYELFFELINRYEEKKIFIAYINVLAENFISDSMFLNKYGLLLLDCSYNEAAEKMFEISLEMNRKQFSVVFYLISALIKQNKFDKIKSVISYYKKDFESYPNLCNKLSDLEQKLSSVLN